MNTPKLLIAMAASAAALALPQAADAATISYDGSGAINYQAAPGEENHFGIYLDEGRLAISDSAGTPLTFPADRCEPGYVDYVAICDMPTALHASFADGRDVATGDGDITIPVSYDGGPGNDVLSHDAFATTPITLSGGTGDDELTGATAGDTLNGGDGSDKLAGREGADALHGDAGDDKLSGDGYSPEPAGDLMDGGAGFDTVEGEWKKDYDSRETVTVTLAGGADDGRAGESDDLRAVEHVVSYAGGAFTGSDGPDDIDINQNSDPSTVRGGGGDDRLDLNDGDDDIDGGVGRDHIEGGFGHDHITGGPGADTIHGDEPAGECSYIYCKPPYGNDTIDARDGEIDQIDCGVGTDTANVDANDVVASCETVNAPGGGGGGGGGGIVDPPRQLSVKVTIGKPKLRTALRRGIPVKVAASAPGTFTAIAKRGSKVVARGTGATSTTLRFNSTARRTLKRVKRVRLKLTVVYTPAAGAPVTKRSTLSLGA